MRAAVVAHRDYATKPDDPRLYGSRSSNISAGRVYTGIYEPGQIFDGRCRRLAPGRSASCARSTCRSPGTRAATSVSAYNWEDGIGPRDQRLGPSRPRPAHL
ncbi:MAG: hypothetical protein R3D59_10405 [Paracoccaceae bacterium]